MIKLSKRIVKLLSKKKLKISFAESCTGGLLSSTITSINGSSKVFTLGLVTYSNQSKINILKILGDSHWKVILIKGNNKHSMAVPKKKKSKSKRNHRHAVWKGKATLAAQKAISLGKSVLTGKAQGFVYPIEEEEESAE